MTRKEEKENNVEKKKQEEEEEEEEMEEKEEKGCRRLGGDIRLCLWAGRLPSLTPKGRPTDSLSARGHHHPCHRHHCDHDCHHHHHHHHHRHRRVHHSSVFTCVGPWMA